MLILIISRVAVLSPVYLLLVLSSCSTFNKNPASVSTIGVKKYYSLITKNIILNQFSKIGTNKNKNINTNFSKLQQQQSIKPVKNIANSVLIKNGHIVYNRKYKNFSKGCYTGSNKYTVKYGDTLFYIAWITGNDLRYLAKINNISVPYKLYVGQILYIGKNNSAFLMQNNTFSKNNYIKNKNINKYNNKQHTKIVSTTTRNISSSSSLIWHWPINGNIKVIEKYISSEGNNKGIDIVANKGQAVIATANGRVVYVGNALRGYGNLIIIKHNDDYLSAYAHNDKMLVKEQQIVKAGQKIATIGSTGTSSTRLHFEIRYKGKSVNPLKYLPQKY